MFARLALIAAAPLALAAAIAQTTDPVPPAASPAPAPQGYLAPGAVDLAKILPPAPRKGELRYEADRRVFRFWQKRVGGARWTYAINDVAYETPAMLKDFGCAAGVTLSAASTPATYRLLSMASADTGRVNNAGKEYWQRLRPFHIDKGKTCESLESLGASLDYPSGHTTKGWTLGMILAELLPERATPILARAREYGESRIVCGVHNMSAVEAGRAGASATMSAVRATAGYQADLAAARAELAASRATLPAPDAGQCAADDAVLAPSVLAGLTR